MTSAWAILVKGVALGLGAAAPIGPVNVEMARRTLRGGFPAGFALGCGAVTVDCTYVILSTVGSATLVRNPYFYWPLLMAGVLMLTYLGTMSWISAIKVFTSDGSSENSASPAPSLRGGYITGLLMTLLNPITLLFWFAAVPSVLSVSPGSSQQAATDLPMICAGVFVGTISWVIGFAGALAVVGRWRRGLWMFLADAFGGTTLLAFAAYAVWRAAMNRPGLSH
jgi:threonine/homoserine/homoserine lactone efflux protein